MKSSGSRTRKYKKSRKTGQPKVRDNTASSLGKVIKEDDQIKIQKSNRSRGAKTAIEADAKIKNQNQGFFSFVFQNYEHQYNEAKNLGGNESIHSKDNSGVLVNLKECFHKFLETRYPIFVIDLQEFSNLKFNK